MRVAGIMIKHSNVNAKDDSHVAVSFVLLPLGFATQARTASHVAAVHFTGSTWEDLIAVRVLVRHYAPADYFVNGGLGRAPLLYNSFRHFEAPLGLCRAATGQAYAQSASWCLRLLLAEAGWFFEREDTLNNY